MGHDLDEMLLGVAQLFTRQEFRLRSLEARLRRMEAASDTDDALHPSKHERSADASSLVPEAIGAPTEQRPSSHSPGDRSWVMSGEWIVLQETVRGLDARLRQHEASMDLLNRSLNSVVSLAVGHELQLRVGRLEGRIAGIWGTLYG